MGGLNNLLPATPLELGWVDLEAGEVWGWLGFCVGLTNLEGVRGGLSVAWGLGGLNYPRRIFGGSEGQVEGFRRVE